MVNVKHRLRAMVKLLPSPIKSALMSVWQRIPGTAEFQARKFAREYHRFGRNQRREIMMSIARFCHINRPMDGYYFEFGCHSASTMRMAWDHFHSLFDWTFVGFDSFEGLPNIEDIDRQEIWKKGKLKTAETEFVETCRRHGMRPDSLMTVRGFYDTSLNDELRQKLLPRKAAVVYVDCDLYASAVPVLEFIKPFLQRGTIIVFDDWYCFHADPEKGERRAFREFREANPSLVFEKFVGTNEAQSFIYLGDVVQTKEKAA